MNKNIVHKHMCIKAKNSEKWHRSRSLQELTNGHSLDRQPGQALNPPQWGWQHGQNTRFLMSLMSPLCVCAMVCHGVPWCAVLCRGVPCCAVLCRGVPWCAVLCHWHWKQNKCASLQKLFTAASLVAINFNGNPVYFLKIQWKTSSARQWLIQYISCSG